MQQERVKQAICWALVALCMALIFYFSSRTAGESSAQSGFLLKIIRQIFNFVAINDFIVRKGAHFLEFTGLCFLFGLAFFEQTTKLCPVRSVFFTSIYAVSDEIHQIFVEGRACRFSDWIIDTAGAILGIIIFCFLYLIIKKFICYKKEKHIDSNNN